MKSHPRKKKSAKQSTPLKRGDKKPVKKKVAKEKKITQPSMNTLRVYNQLIKRGIPVKINEEGALVVDLKKVNVRIRYTKSGKSYATYELREEGAEDITGNYETLMSNLDEIYSYIQDYEKYYLEENPEISQLILDEGLKVTTEMHQHLVTMYFGIKMPILFLKKYAFLIQAFEKGKVQILN